MTLDRAGALARAGAAQVAHLATSRPSGGPHIVPVTFAIDGDSLFTMVDYKPKSTMALQRLENISHQPRVSVLVDHYEPDWANLWWVRIDGVATVVSEGQLWEAARDALVAKYDQYRHTPPGGPAICVTLGKVTWWEPAG